MSTAGRASALDEVDREIEERKARLSLLKDEAARATGKTNAPIDPAKLDAVDATKNPSPRERELLAAAAKIYKPGDVVFPTRLADATKRPVASVSELISRLRRKGLWPYEAARGRKPDAPGITEIPAIRPRRNTSETPKSSPAEPSVEPTTEPTTAEPSPTEDAVIENIRGWLAELPTARARRRVLVYLADRETEEVGS